MDKKDTDVILRVENLRIKFPDLTVAENESFYVKKGEVVIILGDNGTGKSSLLKSLIMTPDIKKYASRDLYFNGKRISGNVNARKGIFKKIRFSWDTELNEFRRSIGYSMQEDEDDPLFSRKVRDYVLEYAESAIDNTGYLDYYDKLFNDYLKCSIYEKGKLNEKHLNVCSGGQKKIVSILKAFSRNNSKLFILDEPINNLDSKHARILNNFLIDLKKSDDPPAILIVTHCHMFQSVDRAYEIKNGKLVLLEKYEPKSCFGECDSCGYYKEEKR